MGWLMQFLVFILQFRVTITSSHNPSSTNHWCPHDQNLLLLQFKKLFTINSFASINCDSTNQPSSPKTISWNKTTDCCTWDGITCNDFTGNVIGLDLSCSQLQGTINSNNTLFQLSYLQRLNLAYNDFSLSQISYKFGSFSSLTYLNLSNSEFSGQIPLEIAYLSKLVSLDFSIGFGGLGFGPYGLKILLQNLTQLKVLDLTNVDVSSVVPMNLSSSLRILRLGSTGLHGKLSDGIFHLPNLERLELQSNTNLTGHLPKFNWNSSVSLRYLDFSFTSLSGELPDSIGKLKLLNFLDLSDCQFSGSIPESLGNLTQINHLILSSNNLIGQVPSTFSDLEQLISLNLSENHLEGQIPDLFGRLKKLTDLSIGSNKFIGQFPSSIANLTQLESLDLSNCSLIGSIPSNISGFSNLVLILMNDNSLNGTIPSWLFTIPSLQYLDLSYNQLTGQISAFQYKLLKFLALNNNKLYGPIPQSISEQLNLTNLFLSSNNFSGDLEIGFFSNLNKLRRLHLSDNRLSLSADIKMNTTLPSSLESLFLSSCEIKELDFLREAKILGKLDLSYNKIHGQIPDWAWSNWEDTLNFLNLSNNFITGIEKLSETIVYIDLRFNLIQGSIPILPPNMIFFSMAHNNLIGEIPPSICNWTSLVVLDLSHNNLSGLIPQCLVSLAELSVVDLQMNRLQGNIPTKFTKLNKLRTLNLRGNLLEGIMPQSLANCRELEVLDLGNNTIIDRFPHFLETLPNLQVLILNSNRFHGSIHSSDKIKNPFPKLRIIDLSYNEFTGLLPANYIKNFQAMKNVHENEVQLTYLGQQDYHDSTTVILKGQQSELVRILSVFTTIDLSKNNFEGEIPNIIGDLNSLRALNLSYNNLGGRIPSSLGNVTFLESLDLSFNRLEGEIPIELTYLRFLAVINFSENHFMGRIPRSTQFDTFQNNSYIGNSELCGFPLSKNCGEDEASQAPPLVSQKQNYSYFFSGFNWKSVLTGYGTGTVFGLILGSVMFLTRKPKWFTGIIARQNRKKKRLNKGNRNNGRRN